MNTMKKQMRPTERPGILDVGARVEVTERGLSGRRDPGQSWTGTIVAVLGGGFYAVRDAYGETYERHGRNLRHTTTG